MKARKIPKQEKDLLVRLVKTEAELDLLKAVVHQVYFAAWWTGDRQTDDNLWSELRDAAGIAPGAARAILGEIDLVTGKPIMG